MKGNSSSNKQLKKAQRLLRLTSLFTLVAVILFAILLINPNLLSPVIDKNNSAIEVIDEDNSIENGIHLRTGFVEAEGLMTVINNCTNCHSSKLVIQNRMNSERWNATIKWMQETQNLWDLGTNQEIIVNYLVTNYPPVDKGRRESLSKINWYELNK